MKPIKVPDNPSVRSSFGIG